jgi:hypothetical protein
MRRLPDGHGLEQHMVHRNRRVAREQMKGGQSEFGNGLGRHRRTIGTHPETTPVIQDRTECRGIETIGEPGWKGWPDRAAGEPS